MLWFSDFLIFDSFLIFFFDFLICTISKAYNNDNGTLSNNKRRRLKGGHKSNFKVPVNHNSLLDGSSEEEDDFFDSTTTAYFSGSTINNTSNGDDGDNTATGDFFSIVPEDTHIDQTLAAVSGSTLSTGSEKYGRLKKRPLVIKKRGKLNGKRRDTIAVEDDDDVANTSANYVRHLDPQRIPVSILPDSFQSVFNFNHFNQMQSEAFDTLYNNSENCVISSPTGSGKTVLFELAILHLLNLTGMKVENSKILYIAPTKSLCSEIFSKWKSKFLGLTVGMLTSDTSFLETDKVKKSNIIITTPEKWDLLTRKWKDYSRLFELVRLLLVDEIHTISERRGPTLEVVLTRMKTMCKDIRIVAASATIPNIEDVAHWLKKDGSRAAKVHSFDDRYRQVTLEKHVYGYNFNCKNDFQRDAIYNTKLLDILQCHSKDKPTLIFCPTRSSTITTAKYLSKNLSYVYQTGRPGNFGTANRQFAQVSDKSLSECLQSGVAFHNAGLSLKDRSLVEQSFIDGKIKILCSTSTLAVGVNLPAYLVVIKGTRIWTAAETKEYSTIDILQMIGRAGRPQYESEGCAVVMSEQSMKSVYENLISGSEILESMLHLDLIEHMCSEISLGTITSIESAIIWLRSTFLFIRFAKNPFNYSQLTKLIDRHADIDQQLRRFCQHVVEQLEQDGLIEWIGSVFRCTALGHAMVRHYVQYGTMKRLIFCQQHLSVSDSLLLLSKADEFADSRVRQSEKRLFREVNMSPLLRYPFLTEKGQCQIIDQTFQKVSLLIQYELGGLEYPTYDGSNKVYQSFIQDKLKIFRHSYRVMRCMIDCFIEKKDGISLKSSLFLLRCIIATCWENSPMMLRQLISIGLISVRKLMRHNILTLDDLSKLSEEQIEYYLGLKPGGGHKIRADLLKLPALNLKVKLDKCSGGKSEVRVSFKVEIDAKPPTPVWHDKHLSLDILTHLSSGDMVDFRRIQVSQLLTAKSFRVSAILKAREDSVEFSLNCQEVVGLGKCIIFSSDELPQAYQAILPKFARKQRPAQQLSILDKFPTKIPQKKNLSAKEALDVLLDSSSDDSLFELQQEEGDSHKITEGPLPVQELGRGVLPNGNFECHHTCKNKKTCRHVCCKEGIPENLLKEKPSCRKNTALPASTLTALVPHVDGGDGQRQAVAGMRTDLPSSPISLTDDLSSPEPPVETDERRILPTVEEIAIPSSQSPPIHAYSQVTALVPVDDDYIFPSPQTERTNAQTAIMLGSEKAEGDESSVDSPGDEGLAFLGSDVDLE